MNTETTKIANADGSSDHLKTLLINQEKVYMPSSLNFLNEHKGMRLGKVHMVLASTGAGKTTLAHTMIADIAKVKNKLKKILVWLSEETGDEYLPGLLRSKLSKYDRSCIDVVSELELSDEARKNPALWIEDYIAMNNVDFLIFDNITTSQLFYQDKKISVQSDFVMWLKKLTKKHGLYTLIFAHTSAEIGRYTQGIISENHVRGCKSVVNNAEFLYILQQFQIGDRRYQTLRIEKHRGQPVKNNFFMLEYDPASQLYTRDFSIPFIRFKELMVEMHSKKK